MYDRVIDWYKVAESKAQFILTINGAFVAITFGLLSSNISDLGASRVRIGPDTWCFLGVALLALCGSIGSATFCLQSRHEHNIRIDFTQLGVDRNDKNTYRPEALWYFGHVAELHCEWVIERLRAFDEEQEFRTVAYNVHGLARVVLRKHRLINAGWTLTAVALIALMRAAASILIRGHLA